AAPEERLPLFVDRLQLEPDIERVDRSAREKVPDLACSNDYVHAHVVAASHRRIHSPERRRNSAHLASRAVWQGGFSFLADRKGCGQLRPSHSPGAWRRELIPCGRN